MATASSIERRLDQLTQEMEQMRRAQRSQRLPRAETNWVKIADADIPAISIVTSGDPPAEVATAGSGTAVPYYIDSTGKLQPHKDSAGENRTIEVWNTSAHSAVVGGYYQTARMPDGRRLILAPGTETQTVLTAIQVNGNSIQYKTRDILVIPDGDESDWITLVGGEECTGDPPS